MSFICPDLGGQQIKLQGDWGSKEYKSFILEIYKCNEKNKQGSKCASSDEIDDYVNYLEVDNVGVDGFIDWKKRGNILPISYAYKNL